MYSLDVYVVDCWCRQGSLLVLFESDYDEDRAFDCIVDILRSERIYRERFFFVLQGLKVSDSDVRRVREPRWTADEITIRKIPLRFDGKNKELEQYAYLLVGGIKLWNIKPDKEEDDAA